MGTESMRQDVNSENTEFWDRIADRYDVLMRKVKFYDDMVRRIGEDVGSSARVLEVGTGTGQVALELAERCDHVDAVDVCPNMIEIASDKAAEAHVDNVTFSVQSAYRLDSPDSSFDAAVICNTLHVLQQHGLALEEMKRVLKRGGLLVAPTFCHGQTLVAHIASRLMTLTGFRAYRRFTYASYVLFIKRAGFKIEKFEVWPATIPMAYVVARAE